MNFGELYEILVNVGDFGEILAILVKFWWIWKNFVKFLWILWNFGIFGKIRLGWVGLGVVVVILVVVLELVVVVEIFSIFLDQSLTYSVTDGLILAASSQLKRTIPRSRQHSHLFNVHCYYSKCLIIIHSLFLFFNDLMEFWFTLVLSLNP